MKVSLFEVKKGVAKIDKTYVRLITEFDELLTKQFKIKGDSDGRRKTMNFKIFVYIYLMEDYSSPHIDRDEKIRHKLAYVDSGLDNVLEIRGRAYLWKPDDLVKRCRAKYRELQETSLVKLLKGAKQGINTGSELIAFLNGRVHRQLEALQNEEDNLDTDDPVKLAEERVRINDAISLCFKAVADMQKLVKELPTTLNTLEDLEKKVLIEESQGRTAKGGHRIGNRADPKV